MIGSYVHSKDEEGQSITTEKEVSVNYQPDDGVHFERASFFAKIFLEKILQNMKKYLVKNVEL